MTIGDGPGSGRGERAARLRPLLVAAVLTVAAVGGAGVASAEEPPPEDAFVVELQPDGDATVTVSVGFDLTTDGERAAFDELRENESARTAIRDRFADRLATVANETEHDVDREMSVASPSVALSTTDDGATGVVAISATWNGLAERQDGRLVVSEPFASGFAPDRRFVVRAPDGYALDATAPEPDSRTDRAATWSAGSELSEFEVAAAESDAAGDIGGTGVGSPGFGVGTGALGLLVSAFAARRLG